MLTTGMLRRGMERLQRPRPGAIMFGLEQGLDSERLVTLTWKKAKSLELTEYSRLILRLQPIHLHSRYVFWDEYRGKPMPIFGFEQEVFDAFGRTWNELRVEYSSIQLYDEGLDAQCFLQDLRKLAPQLPHSVSKAFCA